MLSRREWVLAAAALLLLWSAAALGFAPRLRSQLESVAAQTLSDLDTSVGGHRFDRLQVRFDGQTARVSGAVRNEADKNLLLARLATSLRTPGNPWNPVERVIPDGPGAFAIRPLEAGWLLAAFRGFEADIVGICAHGTEREALEEQLRRRWPSWRGSLRLRIQEDSKRFDQSATWLQTVRQLPAPENRGPASARLLIARIGQSWQDLFPPSLASPKDASAMRQQLGISAGEWAALVDPLLQPVMAHRAAETAWFQEQQRLLSLPPAHVFLGRRQDELLLRGEVHDTAAKRALLYSVMTALPGYRILDDVRNTGNRRPSPAFVVPPSKQIAGTRSGKAFYLAMPGQGWQALDWEVGPEAQPWKEHLPANLESGLVQSDGIAVIEWLQGGQIQAPTLQAPPQPAFLTLAAHAGRIHLGGRLAEPGLHAVLVSAVRRAYPSGWMIEDQISLSGTVAPSATLQHTLQSIPIPNDTDGALPILAIALPGQVWSALSLESVGDLTRLSSKDLPPGFPISPAAIADVLHDPVDKIRARGFVFPQSIEQVEDASPVSPPPPAP